MRHSWEVIFKNSQEMRFSITDVHALAEGGFGWVTCTENILSESRGNISVTSVLATNIFERWRGVAPHPPPRLPHPGRRGIRRFVAVLETASLMAPALRLERRRRAAVLYGDPDVTRFLPGGPFPPDTVQTRSERSLARFAEHWTAHGWGVWAVVDKATRRAHRPVRAQ